ncbi:MAG: GNAT family N-acetyltransferase [Methanobacterium sp.]|nr:GNAT family N-acetyltransferase [Methanobacterium sp.]
MYYPAFTGGISISYYGAKELQKQDLFRYNVQRFLFSLIDDEFGYGYIADYHQDIIDMESYYIIPDKNNFYVAIDHKTNKIIGSIGIRAYDRDFINFKDVYNPKTTASIWRVFVDRPWRRNGVASALVKLGEEFCQEKEYEKIYLHTQKTVEGSLDFWLSKGYRIVEDTNNNYKTVHMEKKL